MAWGQEAPGGYLARGLGGFKLSEAPPPKRPTKPLPPLPIAYNPQPSRSGHTAKPITQTAAQSEFRASSETHFLTPGRSERFELAHGGTILLDEISEMPLPLQAKLLRVLQEREFERVGGNRTIKVDVRVIAATNRKLEESIEKQEFRQDLYFRLNVVPIHVPPLRDRVDD